MKGSNLRKIVQVCQKMSVPTDLLKMLDLQHQEIGEFFVIHEWISKLQSCERVGRDMGLTFPIEVLGGGQWR